MVFSKINDIKFPIIAFSQNLVFIFKNIDDLITCGIHALKKGFYKNMVIIDSNSKKYIIEGAQKVGYVGSFWGFRLFESRQVKVKLSFRNGSSEITLEQLKHLICDTMDKKRFFWESAGDIEELKNSIRKSNTFIEIIQQAFFR